MHKHKPKSKSHRWGAWSEWSWDGTQQAYVRYRQDSVGHLDQEWNKPDLNPAGHAQTPRDAGVEDITERLSSLSPMANEAQSEEYAYADAAPEELKTKQSKSKSKDKEKSHCRRASSDGKASTASQGDVAYVDSAGMQYSESAYGAGFQSEHSAVKYSQYGSGRTAYSSALHRPSRYAAFDQQSEASSSQVVVTGQDYTEEDVETTASGYGDAHSGSERSPTPQHEPEQEDDHISATAENEQGELDPRYRIEHSTRFQPGEIFKVHWSEPQGSISEPPKSSSKKQDIQNKFGTKFFVGFRRFIVVANDQGHCTCVPILTYGGKGCNKRGVKPEKHGIVYERGQKSKRLDGEPSLGFAPVRVEMTEEGEKISRESRVNYSKLVTVEHNVKVFFIGHVYPSDWQIVGEAVNYCWNKKIHQKQRRK